MCQLVRLHSFFATERFTAHFTVIGFDSVRTHVVSQVSRGPERFITHVARVWLLPCVNALMLGQIASDWKRHVAVLAFECLLAVGCFMLGFDMIS